MSTAPGPTRTCPKCQMQVPAKAYVCAYCKKRLRTGPVAMGCAIFFGLAVLLSILTSSQTRRTPSTSPAAPPPVAPTLAPAEAKRQADEAKRQEEQFLKSKAGRIWAKHNDWSRETCEVIAQGKIGVGMTADQVRAAWGKPERINSSLYASGTHEQWVYRGDQYVYFENGIMTSLQQSR